MMECFSFAPPQNFAVLRLREISAVCHFFTDVCMRVLAIGHLQSWMGLHVSHIASAFRQRGHEISLLDYHVPCEKFAAQISTGMTQCWRNRILEKRIRAFRPDLLYMIGSWKYDIGHVKSFFNGVVALHDLDGPRRLQSGFEKPFAEADVVLTVSRFMQRKLAASGIQARYLPSAADPDYYAPGDVTAEEQRLFGAQVSCIGRATPRRAEICSGIAPSGGLALFGDRWCKAGHSDLIPFIRLRRNVCGRELVAVYRASGVVLNMLQEPLDKYRTIFSLQCFAVPSTGGCLLAEAVEEGDEAFENGKEALFFRNREELHELLDKCRRDPAFAAGIGRAGRRRCLAEHTHVHRIAALEKILG